MLLYKFYWIKVEFTGKINKRKENKMKSFLPIGAILLTGLLIMPAAGFAQTSTSTSSTGSGQVASTTTDISVALKAKIDLIASLMKQVQELQAKLQALRAQQQSEVASLLSTLGLGSKGKDVKTLQAILAADPEIYPQGMITGYYGALTAKAVKQFQKKHGLSQVGNVGKKTLEKLNEFLTKNPMAFEKATSSKSDDDDDDGDDNDRRLCVMVPPGHLIAPGWLKKQNGVKPMIPVCQILPPGIMKKLPPTSTSTATTTLPAISDISLDAATSSIAVSWKTNIPATSQVAYGTSTAFGSLTALDTTLVTTHSQTISGLQPNTAYHLQIQSKDASSTSATSSDQTITTDNLPDTTAPVISNITSTTTSSTTAAINWTTDEPSKSKIYYSLALPLDITATSTLTSEDSALVTSHILNLTGLTASSTYGFIVESKDVSNNVATSSQQTFMTPAQ